MVDPHRTALTFNYDFLAELHHHHHPQPAPLWINSTPSVRTVCPPLRFIYLRLSRYIFDSLFIGESRVVSV